MKNVLSYTEYNRWFVYLSNKKPDVAEVQLATISTLIAQGLGNKDAKMRDFLITKTDDETPKKQAGPMTDEAIHAVFAAIATPLE